MTVRVERTFELSASPEQVWEFISDPEQRARTVSVVKDFELSDSDGTAATWYVTLPIPLIDKAVAVHTQDADRDPPRYVRFVGRSKVMRVEGEHTLEPTADGGTRVINRFVVEGRLPGVERYFKRNLDAELSNLETALREALELEE